ncbi:MAG: leucine-rich repeat domain-containing protein [Prevotella sp.]|nr:leucine-rich repeat domain-containing protein [Prevotella sp.]
MLSTMVSWAAVDDDIKDGVLWYKVTNESPKEVKVYKYDGKKPTGALDIPAKVNDYSVTNIGEKAFDNCSGLNDVTIPNSVTSIGKGAFGNCYHLISVTIPASVKIIDANAFFGCSGLETVYFADGSLLESIGNKAFLYCESLTSVIIPDGVTSIGNYSFGACSNLTGIAIPASVKSIGANAFESCESLTSVIIGSGLKKIGESAFYNCSSVTDVYCYADLLEMTWNKANQDFKRDGKTVLHVTEDIFDKLTNGGATNYSKFKFMSDLCSEAPLKANSAVPGEYWTTYYNGTNNVMVTEGTFVYMGVLGTNSVALKEVADGIINSDQAVILKSNNPAIPLLLSETSSATSYDDNGLQGVSEATAQGTGETYYVLSNGSKGVGFYKLAAGESLAANKAFFSTSTGAGVREFFEFEYEETTTTIGELKDGKIEKRKSTDTWYTLDGRKLQGVPIQRGIYIHNGSKEAIR